MTIREIAQKVTPLLKEHRVIRASIFGSVARGEDTSGSDVDMLIEVSRPHSLVQFVALKRGLETSLNKPVDLVEYGAIKPAFADDILKDATVIYENR